MFFDYRKQPGYKSLAQMAEEGDKDAQKMITHIGCATMAVILTVAICMGVLVFFVISGKVY